MVEIDRRVRLVRDCHNWFDRELYDIITTKSPSLTVRMLKSKVIEALPYGCVAWTLKAKRFTRYTTGSKRRNSKFPGESLAFGVMPTAPTSRSPKPSRRRDARTLKGTPRNGGSSSWGRWYGKTRGDSQGQNEWGGGGGRTHLLLV